MIARDTANGALSAGFITKLQTAVESPRAVFRFETDSTTDLNEALDDSEVVIDVDDSSVFNDGDIIKIDDEQMLVVDDAVGANQIQITRAYGTSIAATHSNNEDIYIMIEYPIMSITDLSIDPLLGESEAVVEVSNADLSWNIFLSDLTNHGNLAAIELKFDGLAENMPYFTGVVNHVEYSSERMSCSIYLDDRLKNFLNQVISPSTSALDMVNGASDNPMDFIWDILVSEGGLDSETSQANIDIDYTKWNAVKTKLTGESISIGARIPRFHTYRTAIQMIVYQCSCWAFLTNEGKIGFAYQDNDAGAGDDTWTQAHILGEVSGSKIDGNRVYTEADGIINWQNTGYGYDSTNGTWTSSSINQDGTSQGDYGVQKIAELDTMVWHADAGSASGGSDWVESIHKDPKIYAEITTWLYGARIEIGDTVDLTDADYGFSNALLKVMKIMSFNLTDFTVTVLART